jgi:hypothetical protein
MKRSCSNAGHRLAISTVCAPLIDGKSVRKGHGYFMITLNSDSGELLLEFIK